MRVLLDYLIKKRACQKTGLSKSGGTKTMSKFSIWCIAALIIMPASSWAVDNDCELGARYYKLSNTAKSEYRTEDALLFLQRAAKACPSYQYFQEMAELATEFGDPKRNEQAAEAYGEALDLATTDTDRARSIARYAELLFHNDNPQKAQTYIIEARNLDTDTVWIAELSQQITQRAANVTSEDIKRGLADMAFKPLRLNRSLPQDRLLSQGSSGSGTPASAAQEVVQRSINIPLNFQSGSTTLDGATQKNLHVLADTLVQDDFKGQQFMLIGHADRIGNPQSNLALSVRRANVIAEALTTLQPSLRGRVTAGGKGDTELLSTGWSASDHAINRRLEVVLINSGG